MGKDDKDLLLKDLCARLPYGVKCERYGKAYELDEIDINRCLVYVFRDDWYTPTSLPYRIGRDDIIPYLRPMSSMTEKEQSEFVGFHCVNLCPIVVSEMLTILQESKMLDWLNEHHFDYRGLIDKGLALEAPKDMYQ